jgi:probable HAF family extracellular repeat protein
MKPAAILAIFTGFVGSAQIIHASLVFTSLSITGSPFGLNDSGDIVGTSLGGQRTTGFLYSGGVTTTLNVPGSANTFAYGINNSGVIVGTANGSAGTFGFIRIDEVYTPITVPGASSTTVRGINDDGELVGYSGNTTGRQTGFLSTGSSGVTESTFIDSSFTPISVPGSFNTFAFRINDKGEIAGYSTNAAGNATGFLFEDGVYETITVPGSSDTFVYGINDAGQIVGSFIDESGTHGFLDRNGIFTVFDAPDTLPTSGTFARDINNAGQILVFGNGSGTFLATEIPEPDSMCLTGAALAGLLILRKRVKPAPRVSASPRASHSTVSWVIR